jgi:hypothetical protein
MCLNGYATLVAFAYSSCLMLGQAYAGRLNARFPQPIFLQGALLAKVVRTQAEEQLDRKEGFVVQTTRTEDKGTGEAAGTVFSMFHRLLPAPGSSGHGEEQTAHLRRRQEQTVESGNWNWEELERTEDGGIVIRASGRHYIQAIETPTSLDKNQEGLRVVHTVVADPWGRIVQITRAEGEAPK